MNFDKQLDLFIALLAGLVFFSVSVFFGAMPVRVALVISGIVFLAGVLFGRELIKVIATLFP